MIKKGFTLIELIVVISIIAILGGILVPKYATYIIKAKETKAEQIGRMIFVSSMRSYILDESFINSDVNAAISEDINIDNVQIASNNGSSISEDFNAEGLNYEIVIDGESGTYVLTRK
ncbi:type II secretion system protein [Clostridium akagii]|uniref:type II secretion system protein n=1 Tax=Clostridium akagii TaxID=91623 RepID=UPI00047DC5F5|nr:prepilin-type N-terminal cleavage/methylation domain-containing protein [Clostridium akagii]